MSAPTQEYEQQTQHRQAAAPAPAHDPSALLDQILAATPAGKRYQFMDSELQKRIDRIEELLPEMMKGQGDRLVKRAMLTFSKRPEIGDCSATSFIRCVLEAAELGLAIDGRLAHAVPFKHELVMMPDYKGLVAVARRTKLIKDCYADVICQGDKFEARRNLDVDILVHERDLRKPRGDVYAAYAIVVPVDSPRRYELMDLIELQTVRARSRSQSGPWKTDFKEMCKKTVIKRLLKLWSDDPAIVRALEIDDRDYEGEPARKTKTSQLVEKLAKRSTPAGSAPVVPPGPPVEPNGPAANTHEAPTKAARPLQDPPDSLPGDEPGGEPEDSQDSPTIPFDENNQLPDPEDVERDNAAQAYLERILAATEKGGASGTNEVYKHMCRQEHWLGKNRWEALTLAMRKKNAEFDAARPQKAGKR